MPITDTLPTTRRGWRRWAFMAASLVVHAGLLAALVVATGEDEGPVADQGAEEEVTYVDIRRFAPPPPPSASAPESPEPQSQPEPQPTRPEPTPQPEPEVPETPPRPTDIVDPVDSLPDPLGSDPPPESLMEAPELPAVEPSARGGRAEGGEAGGVEGGVEGGKEGGVVGGQGEEVPAPGETFVAAVVDRQADLVNRRELPRLMRRLYPKMLQDAGVGGRVVVQFVVGTNGRVDMSTVKVLSATDDAFVDPTREALDEFRFRPARIGDNEVRMLTQMPIVWEVRN
jgi:TonB family protein